MKRLYRSSVDNYVHTAYNYICAVHDTELFSLIICHIIYTYKGMKQPWNVCVCVCIWKCKLNVFHCLVIFRWTFFLIRKKLKHTKNTMCFYFILFIYFILFCYTSYCEYTLCKNFIRTPWVILKLLKKIYWK